MLGHDAGRMLQRTPIGREASHVDSSSTQATMDRYFDLMGREADFGVCYSSDVTWLIADTGEVIAGPRAVRDYVVALHVDIRRFPYPQVSRRR